MIKEVLFEKKNFVKKFCFSPFENVEIGLNGQVGICGCYEWMPSIVGNIYENNISDILKSPLVDKIRKSILDGGYQYCNELKCKLIKNNELVEISQQQRKYFENTSNSELFFPKRVYFSGDLTCNLSCPSCRQKIIKYEENDIEKQKKLVDTFYKNLFSIPNNSMKELIMSTTGELFASEILLQLLGKINIIDFPFLKLHIQTNGLLMEKRWERLGSWEKRVNIVNLTADSCFKNTYEKLRRGGNFEMLIDVIEWFKQKKKENNITFIIKCVVQKDNYKEVLDFYNFFKNLGADEIHYARISDWGTYGAQFTEIDVFQKLHAEHDDAIKKIELIKNLKDAKLIGDFS